MPRFFPDTKLEGDVKTIRTDNGSSFMGESARICGTYEVRRELTDLVMFQYHGTVERAFGTVLVHASGSHGEKALVPTLDVRIQKGTCSRWGEDLFWTGVTFNHVCTSCDPGLASPQERKFGHPATLKLLPLLPPGYSSAIASVRTNIRLYRTFARNPRETNLMVSRVFS